LTTRIGAGLAKRFDRERAGIRLLHKPVWSNGLPAETRAALGEKSRRWILEPIRPMELPSNAVPLLFAVARHEFTQSFTHEKHSQSFIEKHSTEIFFREEEQDRRKRRTEREILFRGRRRNGKESRRRESRTSEEDSNKKQETEFAPDYRCGESSSFSDT
jgi:hypothetical protein